MLASASTVVKERRRISKCPFIVVIILVIILICFATSAPAFIRGLRSVVVVLQVEHLRAPVEAEEEDCVGKKHDSEGVTRCSEADSSC